MAIELHTKIPAITFQGECCITTAYFAHVFDMRIAGFPVDAMPSQEMTNKLGTLIAKQRKNMSKGDPFPYFDVNDFAPDWCRLNHKTHFTAWIAAYQDFALAAAANNCWSFVASYAHLRNCMRIACEANLEGKNWHLAALYDKIARKCWSEKAMRGESRLLLHTT